jgi:hypothetical protein
MCRGSRKDPEVRILPVGRERHRYSICQRREKLCFTPSRALEAQTKCKTDADIFRFKTTRK